MNNLSPFTTQKPDRKFPTSNSDRTLITQNPIAKILKSIKTPIFFGLRMLEQSPFF
ncbi:hypothetical protein [Pseudanabaena mucicola]|uniref:Uncharacterized protein n=1 Tax=Pseudanabaena mucicola FACHB-723 TaxID=2692860 RepID=A0ABR7ZZP2_9CYAN|nr:hypothetical protein [Pseudanabaena mucicola]MBD2189054.1 hypothetical protein [Pseudanabaena mucicola FACHB-723]